MSSSYKPPRCTSLDHVDLSRFRRALWGFCFKKNKKKELHPYIQQRSVLLILPMETHNFILSDSSLCGLLACNSFSTQTRHLASCISSWRVGGEHPGPSTCAVSSHKTCHDPHPHTHTHTHRPPPWPDAGPKDTHSHITDIPHIGEKHTESPMRLWLHTESTQLLQPLTQNSPVCLESLNNWKSISHLCLQTWSCCVASKGRTVKHQPTHMPSPSLLPPPPSFLHPLLLLTFSAPPSLLFYYSLFFFITFLSTDSFVSFLSYILFMSPPVFSFLSLTHSSSVSLLCWEF